MPKLYLLEGKSWVVANDYDYLTIGHDNRHDVDLFIYDRKGKRLVIKSPREDLDDFHHSEIEGPFEGYRFETQGRIDHTMKIISIASDTNQPGESKEVFNAVYELKKEHPGYKVYFFGNQTLLMKENAPDTWMDIGHREKHLYLWWWIKGKLVVIDAEYGTTHEDYDEHYESPRFWGRVSESQKSISLQTSKILPEKSYKMVLRALNKEFPGYEIWNFSDWSGTPEKMYEDTDGIRKWKTNQRKTFKNIYGDREGVSKLNSKANKKSKTSPLTTDDKEKRKNSKETKSALKETSFTFWRHTNNKMTYLDVGHRLGNLIQAWVYDKKIKISPEFTVQEKDGSEGHSKYFPNSYSFNYSHTGRIDHTEKLISMTRIDKGKHSDIFDIVYELQKMFPGYKVYGFKTLYNSGTFLAQNIVSESRHIKHTNKVSHEKAYFIHRESLDMYLIKKPYTHTKAILVDATKKAKRFGVQRDHLRNVALRHGFESVLEMADNKKASLYNVDVLKAAAQKGWIRVSTYKTGNVEIQANSYKDVISVLRKLMQEIHVKQVTIELYGNDYKILNNQKEIIHFLRTGEFKRIPMGDFQ